MSDNLTRFTLRLPPELVARLDVLAQQNDWSRNEAIKLAVQEFVFGVPAPTDDEPRACWLVHTHKHSDQRFLPCDMCGERYDRFNQDYVMLANNGTHSIVCQQCATGWY